jgi:hypothetical protein
MSFLVCRVHHTFFVRFITRKHIRLARALMFIGQMKTVNLGTENLMGDRKMEGKRHIK